MRRITTAVAAVAAAGGILALPGTANAYNQLTGTYFGCYSPNYVAIHADIRGHMEMYFDTRFGVAANNVFSPDGYSRFNYNDHKSHYGASVDWVVDQNSLSGPYADVKDAWASCEN